MWVILLYVVSVACERPIHRLPDKELVSAKRCPINEYYETCIPSCPTEKCERLWIKTQCIPDKKCCGPPACRCKEGFFRNGEGRCVTGRECTNPTSPPPPVESPKCSVNETLVRCKQVCPPQNCDNAYTSYNCNESIKCEKGCNCKDNYLRNSSGICVFNNDCTGPPSSVPPPPPPPRQCGYNEKPTDCSRSCPPQDCEALYLEYLCAYQEPYICEPGCECLNGHLRNSSKVCVPTEQCPPSPWMINLPPMENPTSENLPTENPTTENPTTISPPIESLPTESPQTEKPPLICGKNETYVECYYNCPPDSCDISYTTYMCVDQPCGPGCGCKPNYLRNSTGDCILNEECPPPPWNVGPEIPGNETSTTTTAPAPTTTTSTPKPVRHECRSNETYVRCNVDCGNEFCATSEYDSFVCDPPQPCPPGCACIANFRRRSRKDKTCIPVEECPPVKCSKPNEEWSSCPTSCLAESCADANKPQTTCFEKRRYCLPKCICAKGFYRNDDYDCVPASECPSTITTTTTTTTTETYTATPEPQCKENETNVDCTFKCPNQFCPENDERVQYACKPPRNCPSGCGCQIAYRYKSANDLSCILAEDCPPVECNRQNEEWAPCPSGCFDESCANADAPPSVCNELVHNCQPKCICKKGYYRNKDDVCIPKEECFKNACNANETYVSCTFDCPTNFCPTNEYSSWLACSPPRPCLPGCICKERNHKRRSTEDRTCIRIQECPPIKCSDANEEWNVCPSLCLDESCDNADTPKAECDEAEHDCLPKCVCKKDFYRNNDGACVAKQNCSPSTEPTPTSTSTPAPNQCPPNEHYVNCKAGCPTDYCPTDDSRGIIACDPPYPCLGGCICDLNHKRKSYDDSTCIVASDCPPVNCTRENEVWSPCPSPCLIESCDSARRPTRVCNYLVQNCQPRCVCAENNCRNQDDVCVPINEYLPPPQSAETTTN